MSEKLTVALGERSYDIIIERGCAKKAGEYLDLDRRVLVVTDDGVPAEYARRVADACRDAVIVTVGEGEASKSITEFENLLTNMIANGFSRRDCVVAVGGGVVGDLSGFAASAYMRGIDFYNIPTTALSQIDSSVGGKTAVNLCGIKNIVGSFYQPRRVLVDVDTLSTLPRRLLAGGLCEGLKMAATFDAELFSEFERGGIDDKLEHIVARSLDIKRRVVEADEREGGLRRVLNFGHTLGHGIEAEAALQDNHNDNISGLYNGECVSLGMLPMCSPDVRERLLSVYETLGLPTKFSFDPDRIMEAAMHDKKASDGGVSIIYVEKIGTYEIRRVTYDTLRQMLTDYMKEAGQ